MHRNNAHSFIAVIQWPLLVLALHTLASITGAYWQIDKLDNVLHFLGGMSIAAAGIAFFRATYQKNWREVTPLLLQIIFPIAVTALAAVSWELMEFIVDTYAGAHMQGDITDTMSDLALGLTGGTIVTLCKQLFPRS